MPLEGHMGSQGQSYKEVLKSFESAGPKEYCIHTLLCIDQNWQKRLKVCTLKY